MSQEKRRRVEDLHSSVVVEKETRAVVGFWDVAAASSLEGVDGRISAWAADKSEIDHRRGEGVRRVGESSQRSRTGGVADIQGLQTGNHGNLAQGYRRCASGIHPEVGC